MRRLRYEHKSKSMKKKKILLNISVNGKFECVYVCVCVFVHVPDYTSVTHLQYTLIGDQTSGRSLDRTCWFGPE